MQANSRKFLASAVVLLPWFVGCSEAFTGDEARVSVDPAPANQLAAPAVVPTPAPAVQPQLDPLEICGACGSIAKGDFSISGTSRLDGFFQAVGTLGSAVGSVKSSFDADILALAEVYGVAAGEVNAAFVASVVAAIKADVTASAEGGLKVKYKAPSCRASVSVAVQAQARCEAKAGCMVMADPGKVSVECKGSCSGKCEGSCTGSASCKVKAAGVNCMGACEGSCALETAAQCDGICRGTCSAGCSATSGDGTQCAGTCSGTCTGTCELKAAAQCSGSCSGTCSVEQGAAECSADAECSGSCEGKCSGECKGEFTPPSASANCGATAECQGQAKANAEASMECTPPSLDWDFSFKAGLDAAAKASFVARLGELKLRGAAILQGAARLAALVDGKIDGEVVFNPAPIAKLETELSAAASAIGNVAPGRLPCVAVAFGEAGQLVVKLGTDASATVQAQLSFVTFITTGS